MQTIELFDEKLKRPTLKVSVDLLLGACIAMMILSPRIVEGGLGTCAIAAPCPATVVSWQWTSLYVTPVNPPVRAICMTTTKAGGVLPSSGTCVATCDWCASGTCRGEDAAGLPCAGTAAGGCTL